MVPQSSGETLEKIYINLDSTVFLNHRKKLKSEDQISTALKKYVSTVYFHTIFLYMITKKKKYSITLGIENNMQEITIDEYVKDIFDSYYADFLLNFWYGRVNDKFERLMKIIDYIQKIANEFGIETQNKSETRISLWTSQYLGISLIFECNEEENINFFYSQRTTSWAYNGERTDLHDIIPIVFALFIKQIGICSLYFTDVYNPATGADDEIYCKYMTPFQISHDFLNSNKEKQLKFIQKLISSLIIFESNFWALFPGCPCEDCRNKLGYEFDYNWQIPEDKIANILISINSSSELVNYCERTLPNWFYFRDFKRKNF
ncbi:MAG: hypothetical protein IPK25_08665 [Saprospiraceae bacterium]|nr:hypothetical protein [Saprospiraceae bacterium]